MVDDRDIYETTGEPEVADEAEAGTSRRPWWQRALKALAVAAIGLVVLGLLVYNFGGMMPPSADAKAQYGQLQAMGAVGPVEQKFHIPIPGCVCHSDNPVLQMEHSKRSLSQCMSCHGGGSAGAGQ